MNERIERCPRCGKEIVARRATMVDISATATPIMVPGIHSEYRGEGGVCYDCDEKNRKSRLRGAVESVVKVSPHRTRKRANAT